MPGYVVTATAGLKCFHQAPAPLVPVPRVNINFSPVTTVPPAGPRIFVSACPFQVPAPSGTKPQPCFAIEWANVSTRVRVLGQPLYLQAPPAGPGNGVCKSVEQISQGIPTLQKPQARVLAI